MSGSETNSKHPKIVTEISNFKEMVAEGDIFVDKTLFIKKIIDSNQRAILITYPKGWGKTLNLDMLKTFFELESKECKQKQTIISDDFWLTKISWLWKAKDNTEETNDHVNCNRDIFKHLLISSYDYGQYMRYQGKYPVILVSFKDIIGDSLVIIEEKLKDIVKSLYKDHLYLADSNELEADQKLNFQKYVAKDYLGNFFSEIFIEKSLIFLSSLLFQHHGQKVYVLVDEYDAPLNFLFQNYLRQKVSLKDTVVKDISLLISKTVCSIVNYNQYTEKIILAGKFDAISVTEYELGCNSMMTYGISDQYFSTSFGFSEKEVNELITKLHFHNHAKILSTTKDWYGGYIVPTDSQGYIRAYVPGAVMNYLYNVYKNGEDFKPKNLPMLNDADIILQALLAKEPSVNNNLSEKLLGIAEHNSVQMHFKKYISLFDYNWITDIDNEIFFSHLLLNTGHLTVQKINLQYKFSIPNLAILLEFLRALEGERYKKIASELQKTHYLKIVTMLKQKDVEGITKELLKGEVVCEDNEMNFNFFHLAAIFGDQKVFEALLKSKCMNHLNFVNDKIVSVKPLDYAFILGNNNVINIINEYYKDNSQTLIKMYGWGDTIFCYVHLKMLASDTSSAILSFLEGFVFNEIEENTHTKLIADVFKQIIHLHGTSSIEKQCIHSDYRKLDISDPSKFSSLKQFEKYLLHHEKAQVVINNNCGAEQKKLAVLKYPIFKNSFYSDEELTFTLCEETVREEL